MSDADDLAVLRHENDRLTERLDALAETCRQHMRAADAARARAKHADRRAEYHRALPFTVLVSRFEARMRQSADLRGRGDEEAARICELKGWEVKAALDDLGRAHRTEPFGGQP